MTTRGVHIAGDGAGWAIDEDAMMLRESLERLGLRQVDSRWVPCRAIYHSDRYRALRGLELGESILHKRVGLAYFHGKPESSKVFSTLLQRMQRVSRFIHRIRVSTRWMESFLEEEGFAGRVQRIPIGVDVERFRPPSSLDRQRARERFGIPSDAFVVGSFQKDGGGWNAGETPKTIKGPDILVETLEILRPEIENLMVMLTGPSRGFVESRLRAARVKFVRVPYLTREEVPLAYKALDAYLISSREEGGPKAFLESLASGIPLVSTPVGQVVDLANQSSTLMSTTFDPFELADLVSSVASSPSRERQVKNGRELAEKFSLLSQDEDWRTFMTELMS